MLMGRKFVRAIFPGSFDPITNGHLDVVERAMKLFDELIVAVAVNIEKEGLFSIEERMDMVQTAVGNRKRARVDAFDGLLVDFVRRIKAQAVIRGLRALSDFEYEFEMALMNRHLCPEIETLFLMTSQQFFYVSSSRLKELVQFGADISEWVPPLVAKRMREKFYRD